MKILLITLLLIAAPIIHAQGQDSTNFERDAMVVSELLPGLYDNYSQYYFDQRAKLPKLEQHSRRHIVIEKMDSPSVEVFSISDSISEGEKIKTSYSLISVEANNTKEGVQLTIYNSSENYNLEDINQSPNCTIILVRGAEEFYSKEFSGTCENNPNIYTLSPKHLFVRTLESDVSKIPYKLNQGRKFECYVDIPGVGGGRDEPYNRYDGYKIHDQGGSFEIQTKDKRSIIISLAKIDWPINNYDGVFTRDVLVIYATEITKDGPKELGYAYTEPDVERLGLNFKWMLASCFTKSNQYATPFM